MIAHKMHRQVVCKGAMEVNSATSNQENRLINVQFAELINYSRIL